MQKLAQLETFYRAIEKDTISVISSKYVCILNMPLNGDITFYTIEQISPSKINKSTQKFHKDKILDAQFFNTNSTEILTLGLDKIIYIHDLKTQPPKRLFSFDYIDYINDPNLLLTNIKWCQTTVTNILAYTNTSFLIITRAPESESPLSYKICDFKGIQHADLLPFSSNCIFFCIKR